MKAAEDEKKRFMESFEEEFNDKVVSFELAEFRAPSAVFSLLKLKPQADSNSVWGLLVFCESENYFYSFPQENFIQFYVRRSSGKEEPQSQCISLSELKCRYTLYPKKFFDFLFPKKKNILRAYFFDEDKISHSFELILNKKAADFIDLLS